MTRDEILEAAAQIFSEKGYHAASMQDIALAVDLQKASLYHHFSSKQEILLAILDRALDMLIANMQEVLKLPCSPDVKLRQAMLVYMQTVLDYRNLAVVLLLEYRSLEPDLKSRHMPRRDRFERMWRDLNSRWPGYRCFLLSGSGAVGARLVRGDELDHYLVPARRRSNSRNDR